jgi:hypothetical protein
VSKSAGKIIRQRCFGLCFQFGLFDQLGLELLLSKLHRRMFLIVVCITFLLLSTLYLNDAKNTAKQLAKYALS